MDRYEEELEYRLAGINRILATNDLHQILGESEILSLENAQHTLQERLYQLRLQKEADGIQVHPSKEQGV